ncbi:hypothetical protein TNCV_3076991 [Trichonephila clavipes]|nr:hypothetical protein TNCV_3076991 [Trichonephila clavipes]
MAANVGKSHRRKFDVQIGLRIRKPCRGGPMPEINTFSPKDKLPRRLSFISGDREINAAGECAALHTYAFGLAQYLLTWRPYAKRRQIALINSFCCEARFSKMTKIIRQGLVEYIQPKKLRSNVIVPKGPQIHCHLPFHIQGEGTTTFAHIAGVNGPSTPTPPKEAHPSIPGLDEAEKETMKRKHMPHTWQETR